MGTATKTISYGYDAARNRTLMIDPDGGRTTYAYDVLNRIASLINPQGERTSYAYDAKGRRTVKKLANGTRASFTYDAANRLTTLANLKSDNSVISKFEYKYDKVGNRTSVVEANSDRVTWTYDDTYQLLSEHRSGANSYRNTFTYDSVGNRLVKDESGARTTCMYDAANQLKTSVDASGITTYTFDDDGNQELVQTPNNDRTTTTWNYENKTTLVQLPTGVRNTMSYEPDGLRVKLEESTGTKKFIWDDQHYLAESDENNDINVVHTNEPDLYGNLVSQYLKSGTIWTPSYYHQEALGSTRELTNSAEAITDTYVYDAWGNIITTTGTTVNPFQWTGNVGYYFDVDTSNFYIRARIYRPTIGRWLSVDPAGFMGGVNLYAAYFVPNGIDPSGLAGFRADVVAKSFINGVPVIGALPPWRVQPPGMPIGNLPGFGPTWVLALACGINPNALVTATGRLQLLACLASKLPAFNEFPTKDNMDGKYRLFTRGVFKFCCDGDQLKNFEVVLKDKQGGMEGPGVFGTINMSKIAITRIDLSRTRVSWQGWGRPNLVVEPGMQWVASRTSVNIWHSPEIDFSCEAGKGHHHVRRFSGSSFPSRRLWINHELEDAYVQGAFSDLWWPDPQSPSFVW